MHWLQPRLTASEQWEDGQTLQHPRDRGQESVTSPEHHGRTDERRSGKRLANDPFAFPAAANVGRGGPGIGANAGNMDQLLDPGLSGEPRDPRGGRHMDGTEGVLSVLYIETHGIHDAFDGR
jgi:hypothetical protein